MAGSGGTRQWIGWVVVLATLLIVGLVAWHWVASQEPPPVHTPSPTASPSPSASGLAAADGTWCPADDADPAGCVTVALPTVTFGSDPDSPAPMETTGTLGGCWQGTVGADPADAAFIYCPAGASTGDPDLDASDASVDRLWITQDTSAPPMVRSAAD